MDETEYYHYVCLSFNNGDGLKIYPDTKQKCDELVKEIYKCFSQGHKIYHNDKHGFTIMKTFFSYGFVARKKK